MFTRHNLYHRTLSSTLRCLLPLLVAVATGSTLTQQARAGDVQAITAWTSGLSGPSRNTAGTDRLLILTASMEANANETITSATYGGRTLTQVATRSAGTSVYARSYVFYLRESQIALATSNTFAVNWSNATVDAHYAARMYEHVDQSAPIRDFDSASTDGASPNPIVSSALSVAAGDMAIAVAACGNAQTYAWNNNFVEGTDTPGSTSQHSTAQRYASSSGTMTASATNANPNRQVLIAAVLASTPDIYYVRPDGNDSNTGKGSAASAAWQTVAAAATKNLSPGDIVHVMPGTYTATLAPTVDGVAGGPIQFIGDNHGTVFGVAGKVVLQAPGGQQVLSLNYDNYLEFVGFTIAGDPAAHAVKMDFCTDIRIQRCEIYGGLHGVEVDNGSTGQVVNCLIRDNGGEGIYHRDGTLQVWNCTVVGNASDGIEQDAGTLAVVNCIIANNDFSGLDYNGGTIYHYYNLFYANGSGAYEGTTAETGEISQDPLFTSGYQLSSTSPAIDAGTSSGSPPNVDINGDARPVGSGYDVGAYEYSPLSTFLRGHWKLDETSGFTAADSSGNGNDGDLYGTVSFDDDSISPGPRGNALQLDGLYDYIQIPDDPTLQPTTALTITAFVQGGIWGSGNSVNAILRKGEGNPNNYQLAIADGRVALYLDDNDGSGVRGDTVLDADRWYHVAATWDGAFVRIYVDGQLDMTPVAHSTAIGTDTRPLYIGGRSGADQFDGGLDDIRLYGKALTQSEVMDIYGQLIYYKFDETAGSSAADSSYHNLDATLQGSTAWAKGRLEGGLEFDGASDAVTTTNFTPPADGTVLFWMKVPGTPAARGRLFGLHDAFEIRHEPTGLLEFDLNLGTAGAFVTSVPVDTANKWYHIAATFDSTSDEYSVYINGTLDTSGSVGLSQQAGGLLSIGTRTGNTEYFDGILDDLRIFDRVLPADEIQQIRASALPKGLRIIKWVEVK